MRTVEVEKSRDGLTVFVGKVDQNGNYDVLRLSEAEAAVLAEKLKAELAD